MDQRSEQFDEYNPGQEYSTGLLNLFPEKLRDKIVDNILDERYERATDIWYSDQTSGTIWVMRYNIQWQLNSTASILWTQLGKESVKNIVDQICKKFPETDTKTIQYHVADFLILAHANGLVTIAMEPEQIKKPK